MTESISSGACDLAGIRTPHIPQVRGWIEHELHECVRKNGLVENLEFDLIKKKKGK